MSQRQSLITPLYGFPLRVSKTPISNFVPWLFLALGLFSLSSVYVYLYVPDYKPPLKSQPHQEDVLDDLDLNTLFHP